MKHKAPTTTLPAISENEFQTQVIRLAQLRGWRVAHFRPARVIRNGTETWRTPVEGDAGFVDLVLARDRTVIHAELKTDIGLLTLAQKEWQIALGGVVWRPRDWDQIERILFDGVPRP